MKYDVNLTQLKSLLPNAKNILIAVPAGSSIDKLAAGLSLFLTFEGNKQVSIVCEDNILVSQAHLFGIDHVTKNFPAGINGNLTLTLEGVAAVDGTIPSLEKLDWYAENNNLNLVFHVLPGQTFQPGKIVPRYQQAGFDVIFTIGAANLNVLGNIYSQNQNIFSNTHLVNIDCGVNNSSYGQTNVIDQNAASLSEVMVNLISDLGYALDADRASNLLIGIFDTTSNLSDAKVTADTYMAVANCLRVGGKKPVVGAANLNTPQNTISQAQPTYDWNAVAAAINPSDATVSQNTTQASNVTIDVNQPSPEERPAGEGVVSETVEPEWLTPKIFKGTTIG